VNPVAGIAEVGQGRQAGFAASPLPVLGAILFDAGAVREVEISAADGRFTMRVDGVIVASVAAPGRVRRVGLATRGTAVFDAFTVTRRLGGA